MFKIKTTRLFDHRLANLKSVFSLTNDDAKTAIEDIKFSMRELKEKGKLPKEYDDYKLEDEPWIGFSEYHILDNVLVVYFKVEKKKVIRFTTITTHDELRNGRLN